MRYVLDTNAVSALLKGEPGAVDRLKSLRRTEVAMPQPVIAEIEYGIARLPRSKRRARLASRFEIVTAEIERAPWTDEVSERFGAIKASLEKRGSMIADFDIAIAAHALAHRAVLVTADRAHMARISDLEIEDWARER